MDPGQFGAPPGWFPVGYDGPSRAVEDAMHPFISAATFSPRIERYTAYAEDPLEVTDNIELFAELLHNRRETEQSRTASSGTSATPKTLRASASGIRSHPASPARP